MIRLLYIDLFCGAGGTSTGVESARLAGMPFAKVIACVNHDANAIASHAANHPDALHFIEDIRTLDLTRLKAHVAAMRKLYPGARVVLWASLECTNFSIAKGGQSRDADSRTLAEHLYRYVEELNPDYIEVENVKEFMTWGPLIVKVVKDKKTGAEYCPLAIKSEGKGKNKKTIIAPVWVPDPLRKGEYYRAWIAHIQGYGYKFDWRILDAADYGAFTSRKRYFGIFAAGCLPIAFPEPTHTKSADATLFGLKKRHKAVREVLDLDDEGRSIFNRKKMHADATHERIYAGLMKFVAGGKDAFMIKYNSVNGETGKHIPPDIDQPCPVVAAQARLGIAKVNFAPQHPNPDPAFMIKYNSMKNGRYNPPSLEEPCHTVPCRNTFYVAKVNFIHQRNSGDPASKVIGIDRPARTVTATGGNQDVVSAKFLAKHYSGHPASKNISIDGPAHAITAIDHHAIVSADFLSAYYGNGFNSSVEGTPPSVTTYDRFNLVRPQFMAMQYGTSKAADINAPAGSVTTNPKHHLVTCRPWVMSTHFSNVGSPLDRPAPTITANRKHHYLLNPQYASKGGSIDNPCVTLIARMDKAPPYLISADTLSDALPSFVKFADGVLIYEIYDTDTEIIASIKEFMALYGIVDVKMRMLKIPELKRIQGFPANYKLIGTKEEQKKFIGNAVEVNMSRALCCSTGAALIEYDKKAA